MLSGHFQLIDYEDVPDIKENELKEFINARRMKLRDEMHMFEFAAFVEFLIEKGTTVSSEMEALIDLGMTAGITLKKLSTTKKIGGAITKCVRFLLNNRLIMLKCMTYMIGMVLAMKGYTNVIKGVNVVGETAREAVATVRDRYEQLQEQIPEEGSTALYTVATKAMDGIEWVQRRIGESVFTMSVKIMESVSLATGSVMNGIRRCMAYLYEECGAFFGSSEIENGYVLIRYYSQCRMATDKIVTRAPAIESMDDYRMIRMFNNVGAAAEEQSRDVDAREQALVAQTSIVARKLKADIMKSLAPFPTLSFHGLADFLNSLENYRWFESELVLCLQWASMDAVRVLTETGRVGAMTKLEAVSAAYSAVWNDCSDENKLRMEKPFEDGVSRKYDIDLKMTDLFTYQIENFIRCIISEYYDSEVSAPHQALIDADIAKAARQLKRAKRNGWLETLQLSCLIERVHARISALSVKSENETIDGTHLARSVDDLTRMCLVYRFPMPVRPCLGILCRVSDEIRECFKEELTANDHHSDEALNRFVFLSKVEFSQWKNAYDLKKSVYLFDTINERYENIERADALRESLINALSFPEEVSSSEEKKTPEMVTGI